MQHLIGKILLNRSLRLSVIALILTALASASYAHHRHKPHRQHSIAKTKTVVIVSRAPPALRHEHRPAPSHKHSVWIDGRWHWQGSSYIWIGGRWDSAPRGKHWVAGHWSKRKKTYVWIPGHW